MTDSHDATSAGTGPWLLGICMGVMGLFGLILASAAADDSIYALGLILFLVNAVSVFILIGRFVGHHRSFASYGDH